MAPERSATDTSPRDPQRGALHTILRRHLASFLAERERLEAALPRFVVDELEGYLDCGRLSAGVRPLRVRGLRPHARDGVEL